MTRDWWAPLTGVAFVVVLILGLIVGGEPPNADEGRKVVDFYVEDKDRIQLGALLGVIAAALLVWFGATLRDALRDRAGGHDGIAPNVVLAGTVITAAGAAFDATISFALAEAAKDIDPTAVQALQALWDNDFFPIALGLGLFLLASGLSIVRHGLLPRWLGWIAVALGVLAFTPIGFAAFLVGAVWLIVASVMLTLRNRRGTGGASTVAGEPPQPVGVTR